MKKKILLILCIILPILAFVTFNNRGILQRIRLSSEKRKMEEKIHAVLKEQKRLEQQSKALDGDPKAIEKVAREKYGMIREGETVYKVKKEN